jgi:outer membrane protein assembly factor BamE (lipoprotein component of BamABCDE complex)
MVGRFLLLTTLLVAIATFGGCVTKSDAPSLYVGMSRDRLRAKFGEPLRIEQARAGGEDWYYSFSNPIEFQTSSYQDGSTQSASVSATISNSANGQECPIHLSSEGYVLEPLPRGHIVR